MSRYAVIDFETSGLSPVGGDRAIEIGIVIVDQGRIVDTYESLINSGVWVSPFIEGLTGISQRMIANAPDARRVFSEALDFVGDAHLVAHNASFDSRFWSHELSLLGLSCQKKFICTMLMARRLYPWAPDHKLKTLSEVHGISPIGDHHRALSDARMTAELLILSLEHLAPLYPNDQGNSQFLRRYQKMRKADAMSAPQSVLKKTAAQAPPSPTKQAKEAPIRVNVQIGQPDQSESGGGSWFWLLIVAIFVGLMVLR